MRLFCVKKIRGFLFPVSCTSEWRVWRVCQNEHLQHMGGRWRMEHLPSFDFVGGRCRARLGLDCLLCIN